MMKHDNRQKTNRSRLGSLLMKAGAGALLFLMAQSSAWAAYNISYCTASKDREPGDPPINIVLPFGGEIFVGDKFPNYSDVKLNYTLAFFHDIRAGYYCRKIVGSDVTPIPLTQQEKIEILSAPLGYPTIHAIGGKDVKIFPTNVPGIGVSFLLGGVDEAYLPADRIGNQWGTRICTSYNNCYLIYRTHEVTVYLHKIGDIPSGSHFVDASSFPTFKSSSGPVEHPPLDHFLTFSFTGGANIVNKTCDVSSSITVELGEHEKSYFETNEGSPWVDFNIELTNCPAFIGRTSYVWNLNGSNALNQTGNIFANELSYILKPTTPILKAGLAVALNDEPGSAEGIGVQVQGPSGTTVLFNSEYMIRGIIDSPNSVEGLSYNIPFKARYVRLGSNASNIKPGTANTSVEFVINYR